MFSAGVLAFQRALIDRLAAFSCGGVFAVPLLHLIPAALDSLRGWLLESGRLEGIAPLAEALFDRAQILGVHI